jgi:tRNA-modifying protein YgfZ
MSSGGKVYTAVFPEDDITISMTLHERGAVRVLGPDATKFLQGLLTNDVDQVQVGAATFAGLLSPQGKVLFECQVAAVENGFVLDVARSIAGDLARRLSLYKLRSNVEIADASEASTVVLMWQPGASDYDPGPVKHSAAMATRYVDPRHAELGVRIVWGAMPGMPFPLQPPRTSGHGSTYHAHRIALGVPEGGKDYLFGELFPHEAMFDQLNGVSFTKGCYVGQEIVARMQHRGTARSRFLMVAAAGPLPVRGTEVLAGDKPIGQMGSSVGTNGLALIRLDRLGDAYKEGKPITTGGLAITLTKPPYATFEVPTP